MRTVPVTTDWLAMMLRLRRVLKFTKERKFIAASVDVADLEALLTALDPDGKDP
jgi:hypothetical protein